jgi:hypothetical protein
VTLRDHLEEAAGKAGEAQALVNEFVAAGDRRSAFNASMQGFRAALAREARRRPADAADLYAYFTERHIRLIREMPGYVAVEEEGSP